MKNNAVMQKCDVKGKLKSRIVSKKCPGKFLDFRNYHVNQTIIVCGCGSSLSQLSHPENFITIGVNDVGRQFNPDYLVVLNPKNQFKRDRYSYIENSKAKALFTQLSLGIKHPNIVRFKLGQRGGTDCTNLSSLPYTRNSPYVALCLAMYMGAKRIGLIGVDFTEHHFFSNTGTHVLSKNLTNINKEYKTLCLAAEKMGVEIINLSEQSRINAFPKLSLNEFSYGSTKSHESEIKQQHDIEKLNVVSYSITPVSGVPEILSRCINEKTPHSCRCVWASNDYGNGVKFNSDVEWKKKPNEAMELLKQADVVIVHNGKIDPRHRSVLSNKPVITMAHNYIWNVDQGFVKKGLPGVVVGQYQATLTEFKDWHTVPNPMLIMDMKTNGIIKNSEITICYTPSGKHDAYPKEHRLYWHSKGYDTTMAILDKLAKKYPIKLEVIRNQQIPHDEVIAMKQRAHIVIDECVTGSYHRNSLEGLANAAVVVNGVGLLAGVDEKFKYCTTTDADHPFVFSDLTRLEVVLENLIKQGIEQLVIKGKFNQQWLKCNWNFSKQWDALWMPVVRQAMQHLNVIQEQRKVIKKKNASKINDTLTIKKYDGNKQVKITAIIPYGGEERYPLLETVVKNLNSFSIVDEVFVVEMGRYPCAHELTTQLGMKYLYTQDQGPFKKSKLMNMALPLIKNSVFVWLDGDIVMDETFFMNGLNELKQRKLDCLVMPTSVRYLSEHDSHNVINGMGEANEYKPTIIYYSKRSICGGVVMVKNKFVRQHGGMLEGFSGWGGEDNAWFYKARLLGNSAITQRNDQHVYHLYHGLSGGNANGNHINANPDYDYNVKLLNDIRKTKHKETFKNKFHNQSLPQLPWDSSKSVLFVFMKDDAESKKICGNIHSFLSSEYKDVKIESVNITKTANLENYINYNVIILFDKKRLFMNKTNVVEPGVKNKMIVVSEDTVEALNINSKINICNYEKNDLESRTKKIVSGLLMLVAKTIFFNKDNPLNYTVNIENITNNQKKVANMGFAKVTDMTLTEYRAFNYKRSLPRMRQWELPFSLFSLNLSGTMSVLDLTINPSGFEQQINQLYPNILYRHQPAIQNGVFTIPVGVPDNSFDRVVCINTLEHLLDSQRNKLLEEIARKLKPGGMLVITCDQYFDSFWDKPALHKLGVMRSDRQELFNGWNKVTAEHAEELCKNYGLKVVQGKNSKLPDSDDCGLYLNDEPYSHASLGMTFVKGRKKIKSQSKKVVISLLTWNTKDVSMDSLNAIIDESHMLQRLGHEPFIVVCDNGSVDGTQEELKVINESLDVPHKFIFNNKNLGSSIARNQIIDKMLDEDADYLLMVDGDIEIVPFSSFAMLRYMEEAGNRLGCLGADSFNFTHHRTKMTPFLFSLSDCTIDKTNLVAWTQYGMFRSEVFKDGVRFDENYPFDREGWGFEDNDLAFQMDIKGYYNYRFYGITYLHRHHNSSVRVMKEMGINPKINYEKRKEYVIDKWQDISSINDDPLNHVRQVNMQF